MDASAVRAIVETHEAHVTEALGLEAWRITYAYEPIRDQPYVADCERWISYKRATITFDPARAVNDEDVLDSLVHELLHLVLAPLDLYEAIVSPYVPEGAADQSVGTAFRHAIEETLRGIEGGLARSLRNLPGPEPGDSS